MSDNPANPYEMNNVDDNQNPTAEPTPAIPAGDGAPLDPASEEELWTGRTHWQHHFFFILIALIGDVCACFLMAKIGHWGEWSSTTILLTGLLITVAVLIFTVGWIGQKILGRRYRLTGQRLFIEKGILSQTIDQTELIRVDDVRLRKKLVDRIFGLGSIEILSTDTTDKSITIVGIKEIPKRWPNTSGNA